MESDQHLIRGTLEYRRERRFQQLARKADVLITLAGMSPREVYCGLLWYARNGPHRPWKDGWAAHAYREIFGIWPRPEDKGEPACSTVQLEEWIAKRRKPRRSEASERGFQLR